MFFTWTSLSEPYSGNGKPEPVRYGDLPLDFDSTDPNEALKDVKALRSHLVALYDVDPYAIQYFLSGGKGFHAIIPAELLGAQDGDQHLPLIYKKIVARWKDQFKLKTLDLSLYCMARGKMFRIPNVKRSNQRYKVPLTMEEIQDLPIGELEALSEQPREIEPVEFDLIPNDDLMDLYNKGKSEVYHELEKPKVNTTASIQELPKDIPQCISYILREMPKGTSSTFNKLVMCIVTYYQGAGYHYDDVIDQISPFLKEYPQSTSYTTPDDRAKHFDDQWRYLSDKDKYIFDCSYIRGLGLPGYAFDCKICKLNMDPDGQPRKYNLTDMGNGERLVDLYGHDFRYCYPFRQWYVWDSKRWKGDDTGAMRQMCKDMVRGLYREASEIENEARRKELAEYARRCETVKKAKDMLDFAQSEPGIPILPNELDTDIYLINCINGTVNLRTGDLFPHRKKDLITKITTANYIPDAQCPSWLEHLNKIMAGDDELIRFFQKALGYSLTGDTSERKIFIEFGSGANGKSLTNDTIAFIMGDYAMRTPTETLLIKRNEGIPNDIARLKGARFVYASEAEQDKRLAESLIKDMAGGDKITARYLHKEWFEFYPEFKIWLGTNHKPIIQGTDHAIWDRIRLIPFTVRIPKDEQIPRTEMIEIFKKEIDGIFRWLVDGCLAWQTEGLGLPDKVAAATNSYRSEMDVLGSFFDDRCVFGENMTVSSKDLYKAYEEWVDENGEKAISKTMFGVKLNERNIDSYQGYKNISMRAGIGLKTDIG